MAENHTIEIDPHDADSSLGDDVSAATTSLKSSVLEYRYRHGRRYHSDRSGGDYSFPNDEQEQERLDMLHNMFVHLMGDKLFLAPFDPQNKRILDIGTGTGAWAIDFGDEYPDAEHIDGLDLSPIQPQFVPPNVQFFVDDVELDWANPQPYDYIHCRYMAGSIKDWPRLLLQMYDNLKPGGWVEFQESANTLFSQDDTLKPENPMTRMMDGLKEACDKIGRTMDPAPNMQKWTVDAGFERVRVETFKLPIGSWPKDPRLKQCGAIMRQNFIEGVDAFTTVLFRDVLQWSEEEVQVFNAEVRAAAKDPHVHALFDVLVVMGQKPSTG
ncbi:hypothetical protein NLU13_3718 [Sarocladium strictum]|uniref:Uncharacterized protein n=1 Tax=Sarocladium strictum TaxID=5046 RepID=A0AA39GMK1_SARSR|nr:hypothetical protein NLU13_3718 [Sarocladium strictum]